MSPQNQTGSSGDSTDNSPQSAYGLPQSHRLQHGPADPDLLAKLEWLDDLMFAAIDGDPAALESATEAWRKTLGELGRDMLEESRLQYVRHAQNVWNELRHQPDQPPHKVLAAIEIISLLACKMW